MVTQMYRYLKISILFTLFTFVSVDCKPIKARDKKQNLHKHHQHAVIKFDVQSVKNGTWSNPKTWQPARVPRQGDRVKINRATTVIYDVESNRVIRLLQVVGTLRFSQKRDTLLNVAIFKVQNSDTCSESGFACDFAGANSAGEPKAALSGSLPTLEIGTLDKPLPIQHRARIRLHYIKGLDKNDAPALVCCSARMELHGAPMSHTWVKLGQDVKVGDNVVKLAHQVTGWRVGDELIVTGSKRKSPGRTFRKNPQAASTEVRFIKKIDGQNIVLDKPLENIHSGSGDFRSEVANLSRNIIIESANPQGIRGHTLYHAFSKGGISYVRFAHLGKEGVLGRYSIHYHLVGDTMRGSQILGASIVDSHNRWITIHGTEYLVVRDCVGYQSVGHGFFMEDGSEVFNLLDRNLGVQAYRGKRLPNQVLPFDPNDGAAFWWANGHNSLTRNVACENDQYGYRYDSQKRSNFDSNLSVRGPLGKYRNVDIRTLPISRFSENESHTEGLYAMAFAGTDGVGPDTKHPHRLSHLKIWQTHYALRTQLPTMLIENVKINQAAYGIYRPWFENHVYRNLHIAETNTEPFNRGLDDKSMQHGRITVDGLTFSNLRRSGNMPMIQISANNLSGDADSHFRNVKVIRQKMSKPRPLVNLGGGPRRKPTTSTGVPIYFHDYFGKGKHAKIVSVRAKDFNKDGNKYRKVSGLSGDESVVAEVKNVKFPKLLDPVDDLPPVTIITQTQRIGKKLIVHGISHDNAEVTKVLVNQQQANITHPTAGVVDWSIEIDSPADGKIVALAIDSAGNKENFPHRLQIIKRLTISK